MRFILYKIIGLIEVFIGITTFLVCSIVQAWGIYGLQEKPFNVYIFVLVTSIASFILGAGMLFNYKWASKTLVFFSGYIIITKVLIYMGLLSFNGNILTIIPLHIKDIISFIYHILIIILLLKYDN